MKARLNKFTGYTLKDCTCQYCLHYPGKGNPCTLETCCCAEEKEQARQRKHQESVFTPLLHKHFGIPPEPVACSVKPECAGCAIPAHGFLCYFAGGGCVRHQSSLIGGASLVHA